MGHFARVVNNVCDQVIVAEPEFFDTFVDSSPGQWLQVSYNTRGNVHYGADGKPSSDQSKALRGNYPGIGYTYDPVKDVFVAPQPFPSWKLSADYLWEAPVAMPTDGKPYVWEEPTVSWKEVVLPA